MYFFFISRCKKWKINCRRGDLDNFPSMYMYQNYRLCGEHFEKSQFKVGVRRSMLLPHAIPTLFNVPNPPKQLAIKRKLVERQPLCDTKRKKATQQHHVLEHTGAQQPFSTDRKPDSPRKISLKKKNTQIASKVVASSAETEQTHSFHTKTKV